jgi:hypothetical protein
LVSAVIFTAGRPKPRRPPKRLDIVPLAREEQPAGPDAISLGIGGKPLRGIALRLQRDRTHTALLADARAEQLLHVGKVLGRQGTDRIALGEEEVDDEVLPFIPSS